ncbi:unnamed protein product [Adineta ricciae]|uniref:MARVEL domain-containing protein n=1 Tax=Adineta ricciae TaxID=249248 RepID=A0A814I492_ADIRI|nr:unnamed protein product [Adineta ricciae]
MYPTVPYYVPRSRPIGRYQHRTPVDIGWRLRWPFLFSTILGVAMILCILVIGALEVASLAQSTNKDVFGNTSATGAGIWCGVFLSIAAVLILLINYMPNVRLWAKIAFIATIVAVCFTIILIGLDAKAVQDGRGALPSSFEKPKILSAQLAFACIEFVLCLIFITIYLIVQAAVGRHVRRMPRGRVY